MKSVKEKKIKQLLFYKKEGALMKKINAIGKPCPIPVIETKKAVREMKSDGGQIEISVDNEIAVQNIKKMAVGLGLEMTQIQLEKDKFIMSIDVPKEQEQTKSEISNSELVIAFGKRTMGEGDADLGEILLKSYIYSLTELDTPPEHLLFFNAGAFLTNQNSGALKDLQTLAEQGTQISTCGACLDFYQIKDTLAVGEITNMYGITEVMAQAKKVINI